jgi:hypothetical protein
LWLSVNVAVNEWRYTASERQGIKVPDGGCLEG